MSSPQFLFWELGPLHVFKANRLRKMKFGVWVDVYKWCAGRHVQVHASRFKKISAAGVQGLPATPYYNSGTCAVYVKVFELEC